MIRERYKKLSNKKFCKIVVGGSGAVGKTTICQRLTGIIMDGLDPFMTCGVDFHELKIENDELIEAQIWDLGGQEQFRCFQEPFFKKAKIVIIVFSVEWYHSFANIDYWLALLNGEQPDNIYLIGNKIDSENRDISKEEAIEFANERGMEYIEVSALKGYGFEDFKEKLLNKIKSIL